MNPSNWHLFKFILTFLPPFKFGIVLLSLLTTLMGLASPILQKFFLDKLINHHFDVMLLSLCGLSLLLSLVGYQLIVLLSSKVALLTQRELGQMVYSHLLRVKSSDLNEKTIGGMVSVYATDIPSSTIFIEQSLPQGLGIVFPFILAPVVLVYFFQVEILDILLPLLIFCFVIALLSFRQSIFFARFKELAAIRLGFITEWIQNIRTIRMMNWMPYFENKIHKARFVEANNRLAMLKNGQTMNTISSSMTFIISGYLIWRQHNLSAGNIMAIFWIVSIYLTRPFRHFPWFLTNAIDAWTSTKRIAEILRIPTSENTINESPDSFLQSIGLQNTTTIVPSITVTNLNLTINGREILKNISFTIHPEEFVVISGPIGSGKSMLLLSLLGETNATFQSYQIGNIDLLKIPKKFWKFFFAYTCQDSFLISSTLRDNITLNYDETITNDHLYLESLEHVSFNLRKENILSGLNALIGERGLNLSGGQKQRVQLARSLFKQSKIFLFDECLNALDAHTAAQIIKNFLINHLNKQTRILVTNNWEAIRHSHRVILLVNGEINVFDHINKIPLNERDISKWQKQIL
ncbi:MAG: ABC transporter ATP-binding protein/permease [Bdellovibrionaceae bacterium]|nr:ABC transporter ATP-binding protein/permease [Pseudobdellovibrionaceae bacterium]MDW8190857.1 ABC transporter ATP-binding protein/permease [Pseudobdellovibrionaceae bacterium]